jgi:hypothetical protein
MRKVLLVEVAAILCLLIGSLGSAQAFPTAPTYTFNELGNGTWADGTPISGWMQADPGPGGLTNALTYGLPFAGVAGDVVMLEPEDEIESSELVELSDVIRFNGNGTLVFYSDSDEERGESDPADTGFPTQYYTNMVFISEVGPEGANYAYYTPTAGQPGYDPSNPTYLFISDIPEPSTVMLVGLSLAGLLAFKRRRA